MDIDNKILDLIGKIDLLAFKLETYQDKINDAHGDIELLSDKIELLRVKIYQLEQELEKGKFAVKGIFFLLTTIGGIVTWILNIPIPFVKKD